MSRGIRMELEHLLIEMVKAKASDLHLTVGLPPMLRIDGKLTPMRKERLLSQDTMQFTKVLLATNHELAVRFEKEGQVDFAYELNQVGRFRINSYKQRGYDAVAIRLVPFKVPTIEMLNLPLVPLASLANETSGLVLITGPTGSGKSTTLAAMLNQINTHHYKHILTLEDPIEYVHEHKKSMINQREIGRDSASYTLALRAALREDPDVILIGELRDAETMQAALIAAETGHLILSTLHTSHAVGAIERIVDAFSEANKEQIRRQLASVLKGVIAQQLLPSTEGRIAALEVMKNSSAITHLIRENKLHQIYSHIQTGRAEGMITMDQAIAKLYLSGKVSLQTAQMYATHIDELRGLIS